MANQQDQLSAHLLQHKSLPVSPTWLQSFLTTQQRNIHISALTQTAFFRILNSDIRQSLFRNPSSIFPIDIFDPTVQERRIAGPIPVQVLDIEDIGTSIWNQVEAIERVERGEAVRGREIVRTVNVGDEEQDATNNRAIAGTANPGGGNTNANESNGPHRLILQDAKGTRAVGIEMSRISGVGVNTLFIGAKLMIRNATVARGMILLTPDSVTLLGGKIEAMDQAWKAGRKARLLEKITGAGGEDAQS
ncbi:DUF1767-domain-containing protein [Aspergillus karnatakaensis]|uniref:OB fold domain-containing protein n=1 Tax=Aspergillus karnatakaensis TaxID=1810916 RepID=UPI003CCCA855